MNSVVKFNKAEGPNALALITEDIPTPSQDEVVVQMKATGLNRSEHMYMSGVYVIAPEFPSKIGTEGSGIIHSLGTNVSDFNIGDEVCITPNILPNEYGVLGKYMCIPKEAIVLKPKDINFTEAASVWMSLATAYCALVSNGGLKENTNQTVVITAASSAIGIAVIQMAKRYGAKVIATSRSSSKDAFLKENGANAIIHTDSEDLTEKILEHTNGKGFDIAVDLVLGTFTEKLANAAAQKATIIAGGILSMEVPELPFFPLVMKNLKLTSFHVVFHLFRIPDVFEKAKVEILEGLKNKHYWPVIDKVFTLEQASEAYRYLEASMQKGKVVIQIE
ncbi:zinc-dependent alcohol dehydrogenase family protein [uncultured Aquimarina sp.]|uniref:zinc-dependent alcohol dehydrogenase family protein n=1 Tax=uncultured Aquimarina sp. TaxID=575652 RepID=UPI00263356FA|nr:zinc-dependent alcohol dehydrogenase family protein [uncultured Aquimarina sp.]